MNNKVSLIIIAMDEEFSHLLKSLNNDYTEEKFNDETIYSFYRNNKKYIALRGRVGKVSTSFYLGQLSSKFEIERIFNLGTSGGYSNDVNIGDVIIAREVLYHDVDATGFGYKIGQVPGFPLRYICDNSFLDNKVIVSYGYKVHRGLIASGDSFITKNNLNKFAIEEYNPLCVEMEAGAVGQCSYLMNIPFIIIRSISDKVKNNNNVDDSEINLDIASSHCVEVLFNLI